MFNLVKHWKPILLVVSVIVFSLSTYTGAETLNEAAKEGDWAKVKSLIAESSDVNVSDENGISPLHLAARGGTRI